MDTEKQSAFPDLSRRSALIIGMGGLGCPAASALAAAGVGKLSFLDADRVELSNLGRQMLFEDEDLGEFKVEAAARALSRRFPQVQSAPLVRDFERSRECEELIAAHDVVLDGSDNFSTRFAANDLCVQAKTPLIHGAALGWRGQLLSIVPGRSPCLRCVFETEPPPGSAPTCAEAGVVAPLVGVVGGWMAQAALSILRREVPDTQGAMRVLEADRGRDRLATLGRDPRCPSCADLW